MGAGRPVLTVLSSEATTRINEARAPFRARMGREGATRVWEEFSGTIGVVLPGGGARGAYEAGVLLALQDATLPTHLITATSIGSINAAAYAAHSTTRVGNAEPLINTWLELTPAAAGIEWTRYAWMLGGLIAASAGFGNLVAYELELNGFSLHLHHPALTWFALGLAGTAVLLLHDQLPYLAFVVWNHFRRTSWKADRRKTALSLLANLVVWTFIGLAVRSLHVHARFRELMASHPWAVVAMLAGVAALIGLKNEIQAPVSELLHRFLRLPLRPGLFANFERARLLRARISEEQLRASPVCVVFSAADMEAGAVRYFSNAPRERLTGARGADARFATEEVSAADDLLRAVFASSALPIIFEPIALEGRLMADGAIVASQPLRPAIRLGADVLLVVMMEPRGVRRREMKTFVDVGLRSLDILMSQNLATDLKIVGDINAACERAAAESGVRPEEVEIDLGTRRFRYIKILTIRPECPLAGTVLDFGGETIATDILRCYQDAAPQIEALLDYARVARYGGPRHVLHFTPERKHDPTRS